MKLERLELKNFKGTEWLVIEPGDETHISGRNKAGKTTVFDAFTWLLTGKDSKGRADFAVKTIGHRGPHEVSAIFAIEGRTLALSRSLAQKWSRKRGATEETYSGDETTYMVDNFPCKKADYDAAIAEVIPADALMLLTDPYYLAQTLHWTKRRDWITGMVDEVTDAQVFEIAPESGSIHDFLQGHTIPETRNALMLSRKNAQTELDALAVRLSEAKVNMVDMPERIPASTIGALHGKRAELHHAKVDRIAKPTDKLAAELAQARIALGTVKVLHQAKLNDFEAAKKERTFHLGALAWEVGDKATRHLVAKDALAALETQHDAMMAKEYVASEACPVCGQTRLEDVIEQGKADFNRRKADAIAKLQGDMEAAAAKIVVALEDLNEAKKELEDAKAQAENSKPPDGKDVEAAQAVVDALVEQIEQVSVPDTSDLDAEIEEVTAEIASLDAQNAVYDAQTVIRDRVSTLQAQVNTERQNLSQSEDGLTVIDAYTHAKARLLQERVDATFTGVSFKLFNELVNGGMEECCIVTVDNVPFESVNRGHQITAGLEIIKRLAEVAGLYPPVFVDNAEAVNVLPDMAPQQLVAMYVTENDGLKVEVPK